jgi:hypothetical protein
MPELFMEEIEELDRVLLLMLHNVAEFISPQLKNFYRRLVSSSFSPFIQAQFSGIHHADRIESRFDFAENQRT